MQPREPLRQWRKLVRRLAGFDLGVGALDGLAERGALAAHERKTAVDPLQLVARRAGSLGGAFSDPRGLSDGSSSSLELGNYPSTLALLFCSLTRKAGRARGELLIARQQRPLLVA